jgi:hypothetical protein
MRVDIAYQAVGTIREGETMEAGPSRSTRSRASSNHERSRDPSNDGSEHDGLSGLGTGEDEQIDRDCIRSNQMTDVR